MSDFIIGNGLCACTEMLWMCVLYVSFGSKVRPRTFGCVAVGYALLCILGPDCSYILQGLAWTECKLFCLDLVWDCFVLSRQKLYVCMVVYISWLHSCSCVWMWWWYHLCRPWPEPVFWVVVCLQCKCWIVLVKVRHLVERQFGIYVVKMCDVYMVYRLCVPWCSFGWT